MQFEVRPVGYNKYEVTLADKTKKRVKRAAWTAYYSAAAVAAYFVFIKKDNTEDTPEEK